MSIAGILAKGKHDAAELLSKAFAATRSPYDDYVSIESFGGTVVLGVRGRSASLDEGSRRPRAGLVMTGASPLTLESLDKCLSSRSRTSESIQTCIDHLRGVFANLDMGFAAILAIGSHLVGVRDPLGQCPLFYSRTSKWTALSSSRKVLWALGNDEPQVHPSGVLTEFSCRTATSHVIRELKPLPIPIPVSFAEASQELAELVCNSVRIAVGSATRVGILFSGGLDSSVVASAAKRLALETHLYSAAFGDIERLSQATKAARMLKLDLGDRLVSDEGMEDALKHTIWASESADPLQVAVAFPLDVAAQMAVEKGETVLLSGSGADELFGGYSRYQEILENSGKEGLSEAMFNDIMKLGETDLLRDGAVGESNRIRVLAPFLNLRLVEFALNLPIAFKVIGPRDNLRKHILREAARKLNVPAEVANLPKKAAQYSSGSLKVVKRLTRSKGLRTEDYLNQVLRDIRRDIAEKMAKLEA